jgi:hypothetical protein
MISIFGAHSLWDICGTFMAIQSDVCLCHATLFLVHRLSHWTYQLSKLQHVIRQRIILFQSFLGSRCGMILGLKKQNYDGNAGNTYLEKITAATGWSLMEMLTTDLYSLIMSSNAGSLGGDIMQ